MRIGIVCPYSWDVPGGVQFHIRDLAEYFIRLGHEVSVLAPADDDTPLPPYVVSAGRAVPVPYNGSVARLNFGFLSAARVRRWLHEGAFDVIHIHEPTSPSLGLLTCWAAQGPIVATFHTSNPRSRAMIAAYAILQAALEKISARIAVSEYARRTLVEHLGGDAVVIPNGVDVDFFADAEPRPEWQGDTIGFIGRIDEPRKGLPVLMRALPGILAARPQTRLLVAGRGDEEEAVESLPKELRSRVEFLGMISDEDKARFLRSVDLYVAPNTGGESFGIILVEAMSAGAPVLASDLDAFAQSSTRGRPANSSPTRTPTPWPRRPYACWATRSGVPPCGSGAAPTYGASTGPRSARTSCPSTRRSRRERRRWRRTTGRRVCGPASAWRGTDPQGPSRPRIGLRPVTATLIWILVVLVAVGLYLSWTAGRLDRLHARIDAARAALDAQLLRRASVAQELATSGVLDPAASMVLYEAAHAARQAEEELREVAESELSQALRAVFADAQQVDALREAPGGEAAANELAEAVRRVPMARRFHNDAVGAARRLREHRKVRWFRLAGHAPFPLAFEMDDESPTALVERAA